MKKDTCACHVVVICQALNLPNKPANTCIPSRAYGLFSLVLQIVKVCKTCGFPRKILYLHNVHVQSNRIKYRVCFHLLIDWHILITSKIHNHGRYCHNLLMLTTVVSWSRRDLSMVRTCKSIKRWKQSPHLICLIVCKNLQVVSNKQIKNGNKEIETKERKSEIKTVKWTSTVFLPLWSDGVRMLVRKKMREIPMFSIWFGY